MSLYSSFLARFNTDSRLLGWQLFNVLKMGSVFVLAILFAQGNASLNFISEFEHLMLWGSVLSFFYVSGLSQSYVSWYARTTENEQKVCGQALYINLQASALFTALVFVVASITSGSSLYALYALFLIFHIPGFAAEHILLTENKGKMLLIFGVISYSIFIGISVYSFFVSGSLFHLIAVHTIWAFIRWIYCLFLSGLPKRTHLIHAKMLAKFSLPVVGSHLLGGSLIYLNALVVEHKLSTKEFVWFRYGAREFPLFLIMANAFSTLYGGYIAQHWKKQNKVVLMEQMQQKTLRLMHQLFPMAIAMMLLAPYLFEIVYGEALAPSFSVFCLMLFLLLSRVLFPQTLLIGTGATKSLLYASAFELFCGLLLSWILIPLWDISGAAIALGIAFMMEKIWLIAVCYRHDIPFFKTLSLKWYVAYALILVLSAVFSLNPF